MSKSKGNVIAPDEIQEKFGTDALRMGLIVNNAPSTDMNLDPDKVNAYKKFANKLWNISRFVIESVQSNVDQSKQNVHPTDILILNQLNEITSEITTCLEKDQYHLASEKIYHYIWHEFADKIIEESKPIISGTEAVAKASRQRVLRECLITSLKLLHPFMPFVTETIWQQLPKAIRGEERNLLMIATWPTTLQ